MGYTHYFPAKRSFTDVEWKELVAGTKKILAEEMSKGIKFESNADSGKIATASFINFNGAGDESYETFLIEKKFMKDFNFCKTQYRPYDNAVMRVLLLADSVAPGALEVSSDGEVNDWKDAAKQNAVLLGKGYVISSKIGSEEEVQKVKQEIEAFLEIFNKKEEVSLSDKYKI